MEHSKIIKYLSYILVLVFIFQVMPMNVIAVEDSGEIEPKILGELKEQRKENIKVFIKDDFSKDVVVYTSPVHYLIDGKWVDIDNRLIEDISDEEYLINTANDFKVQIAKSNNTNEIVKLVVDGYEIGWNLVNANESSAIIEEEDPNFRASLSYNENITSSNNSISAVRYNEIFENIDLQYIINSELKENIIINNNIDDQKFEFKLYTGELVASSIDKRVLLYNNDNELIYEIPSPIMYDDLGEVSNDIGLELVDNDSYYSLIIAPNIEWINDSEREYPVVIDPEVVTSQDANKIYDNHVSENMPEQSFMLTPFTKVGKGSSSGNNRTYIMFPTMNAEFNDILENKEIQSAEFNLYRKNSNSGFTEVELYKINGCWDTNNITWTDQPVQREYGASTIVNGPGKYTWDITSIVEDWYVSNEENWGVMLQAKLLQGEYIEFHSSDSSLDLKSQRPQIKITYSEDYNAGQLGTLQIKSITPSTGTVGQKVSIFAECANAHHIAANVYDENGNDFNWLESEIDTDGNGVTDITYEFTPTSPGTYYIDIGARNTPDATYPNSEVKWIDDFPIEVFGNLGDINLLELTPSYPIKGQTVTIIAESANAHHVAVNVYDENGIGFGWDESKIDADGNGATDI